MPLPPNRKNGQYVQHERRKTVATRYLQGKSQWEIAREVGCSQKTISLDLKFIREEWLHHTQEAFDQKQAIELAKIDKLEETAWDAWYRSCEDAEVSTSRVEKAIKAQAKHLDRRKYNGKTPAPVPKPSMIPVKVIDEKVSKGQTGDPRFMDMVRWCIETRIKILGLIKEGTVVNNNLNVNWDDYLKIQGSARMPGDPIEEKIRQEAVPLTLEHVPSPNGAANESSQTSDQG